MGSGFVPAFSLGSLTRGSPAVFGTTASGGFFARLALNHSQVALHIRAVDVVRTLNPAFSASRDDSGTTSGGDGDTLIKDDVNSIESLSLSCFIVPITDDAAVELKNVLEPIFPHPSAQLLATNSPGAIGQDVLVFEDRSISIEPLWNLAKVLNWGTNGSAKVAHFRFVSVSAVEKNNVLTAHHFEPFNW